MFNREEGRGFLSMPKGRGFRRATLMKNFAILFAVMIFFAGCSNEPPAEVSPKKIQSTDKNLTPEREATISLSDAVEIRSAVSGRVMEKFFAEGAEVTEGQLLFKIGELEQHTELLQAKAELAKTRTDLAKALTARDPSAAELQLEVEEISERVKELEGKAEVGMVYAPKSGKIDATNTPLGMSVTADETVLAIVGNINPVTLTPDTPAQIEIDDVKNVQEGTPLKSN